MAKKPILLQFDEDLLERLDRLASEIDRSRSSVVREAVERYIVAESVEAKDRAMREAYARIPDDDEFDRAAAQGAKRLVNEEPW